MQLLDINTLCCVLFGDGTAMGLLLRKEPCSSESFVGVREDEAEHGKLVVAPRESRFLASERFFHVYIYV